MNDFIKIKLDIAMILLWIMFLFFHGTAAVSETNTTKSCSGPIDTLVVFPFISVHSNLTNDEFRAEIIRPIDALIKQRLYFCGEHSFK